MLGHMNLSHVSVFLRKYISNLLGTIDSVSILIKIKVVPTGIAPVLLLLFYVNRRPTN